jgi:hypothetical protein
MAFVVVMVILLGLVGAGGYIFYQKALEYTSTEAAAIPIYQTTPEKMREVNDRVDAFKKAYDANAEAQMELSGDDINAIIATSPKWEEMKGKLYVRVADNLFYVDASIPLTDVAGFSDRFLNGTVGFDISVENGDPKLVPKTVQLNGKALPQQYQQSAGDGFSKGFVEEIQKNPDSKAFFQRVKSLKVEGDRVHIHIVPGTAAPQDNGHPDSGLNANDIRPPAPQMPSQAAPGGGAPAVSSQTFVCPKQIMAYDQNSQPLGYFLQGSTLEIMGPSAIPGMTAVRYREPAGNVIEAFCKAEDLGTGAAAPAEAPPKPDLPGLGGSRKLDENPHYKGFGKP